ncbi:MAG: hypothetical protein AAFU85_11375, partial [Planctomycetota bacterium]
MSDVQSASPSRRIAVLFSASVALQIGCASLIAWLSPSFSIDSGRDFASRPILWVVTLWSLAFALQMVSLWSALKLRDTRQLAWGIFLVGVSLRLLFLFTPPIQEVDLYRYLWDGAVVNQGVSPYRFSPEQLREVRPENEDLRRLQELLSERPGLSVVHSRVHYPQVTTVYPPVSQCVFAWTAFFIPATASATQHVITMKVAIGVFDIGTMLLIMGLVRNRKLHSAWTIVYCWSPLVLKEFANSGHLDSIAVFLTTLTLWLLNRSGPATRATTLGSAIGLALAIGAKLYPVVLLPVCFAFVCKRSGWKHAAQWFAVTAIATTVIMAPMFAHRFGPKATTPDEAGLETFLSRWEMNDLIFMVLEENVRPDPPPETNRMAWFAVVPNEWRINWTESIASRSGIAAPRVPFLLTRAITSLAFIAFALWIAWRTYEKPNRLLAAGFITLAWFWFLSPTQNPWYWTWALPLIVFQRNRA